MNSKEGLLKAGFNEAQADAILDAIVASNQSINRSKPPTLTNDVDSVVRACDAILAAASDDFKGADFITSLKANVQKYKTLTPKQFAALEKFHANLQ
jgi:hypothetical protein